MSEKYRDLIKKYGLNQYLPEENTGGIVTSVLVSFVKQRKEIAIYGYDEFAKQFIGKFIFELRNVKYIIDDNVSDSDSGYTIISESEISEYKIDGIVLCCKDNALEKEIATRIVNNNPNVSVLPVSSVYASSSLLIDAGYYYSLINQLQFKINSSVNIDVNDMIHLGIIYIGMKDFRLARKVFQDIYRITRHPVFMSIINDLKDLYNSMLAVAKKRSDNVLLLCLDGLKRIDMPSLCMPKLSTIVYKKGYRFTNAYSVSTTTFESLIPAYSDNYDLRTEYYKKNLLSSGECRFINEAVKQGRNIYFYTDKWKYVDNIQIKFKESFNTAAEKIWNFLVDYENEEYGLFYIHINWECHYSFPNPYTKEPLVLSGTNIILEEYSKIINGEKMRTDYLQQKNDSFRYVDDLVSPFLYRLSCRTLIFADHGNYEDFVYSPSTKFEDIPKLDWSCAETRIRIPLVIISPEMGVGENNDLISLMEFNDIAIDLLNNRKFDFKKKPFIKALRSEMYNPETRRLGKIANAERELLAYECFIFVSNYKLVVYSDASVYLYYTANDREISDTSLKKLLFTFVINEITVCDAGLCLEYLNKEDIFS